MQRSRVMPLALVVVALLMLAGVSLADEGRSGSLVGTWMFKVTFLYADGTSLNFRYLQTFNSDGVTTLVLPDPGPGYTDGRSACVGQWKHAAHGQFAVTVYCLESQDLAGWFDKIKSRFSLSSDGMHLSDPHFSAEWWLGDVYQGIGYGSMEGVRLAAGPVSEHR
jgi:hypothetical protein